MIFERLPFWGYHLNWVMRCAYCALRAIVGQSEFSSSYMKESMFSNSNFLYFTKDKRELVITTVVSETPANLNGLVVNREEKVLYIPFDAFHFTHCRHCIKPEMKPLEYSYNWKNQFETIMVRCLKCLNHEWITVQYLASGLYANDKNQVVDIIDEVVDIENLENKIYLCDKCSQPYNMYGADTPTIHKTIMTSCFATKILRCDTCNERRNLIYLCSPIKYFESLMTMAKHCNEPFAAIVFTASAIEAFISKCYASYKATSSVPVELKKTNFQSSEDIKILLRESEIVLTSNNYWESLTTILKARHAIIHNAGFDKNNSYKKVYFSKDKLEEHIENVQLLIQQINKEYIKRGLPWSTS
jgi:hypothetical protein